MSTRLPKVAVVFFALQAAMVASLYYDLYHKHQMLGACHASLAQLQTVRTQLASVNVKLDASDAALATAEAAQSNRSRP